MRFRVDVDDKKIKSRIEKRINKGIKNAAGDISRGIERRAKARIRREGAIWRHHLIEGFEDATLEFGSRTTVQVRNVSEHAPAQEYGVSGTEVKRDTPLAYDDKMPPVTALIPWVRAHLVGTGFDPYGRGGGSSGSSGSSSGGSEGGDSGSGGADVDDGTAVTTDEYDPLMGADELTAGTGGLVVSHPSQGTLTGSVERVHSDDKDYDYYLNIDGGGYIDIRQEWISTFDGKGADAADVEAGKTVYVGSANTFAVITEPYEDPDTGDVTGARVDFDNDGTFDDLLSLDEFEIVTDQDPFNLQDNPILTDENGLYVPGTNFQEFDPDAGFDMTDTYPGQRLVVLDRIDRKYRRAEVVDYPDRTDRQVKVQFDDDDGITHIENTNAGDFRLVGGEFWDSLTEAEQKSLLEDYFEDHIRDGHEDFPGAKGSNGPGLADPTDGRLDWFRDNWMSDVWEHFQDSWYSKEVIRNMDAQFGSQQSRVDQGALGGVAGMDLDESSRMIATFISKTQLQNSKISRTETEYIDTLHHESLHGVSTSNHLDHPGSNGNHEDLMDHAEWDRDGTQTNSVVGAELVDDATLQMFHDAKTNSADPVGGTDWVGDAYDAAMNGRSGIKNYDPTFKSTDNLHRVHEAANHAYWLQSVAGREVVKNDGIIKDSDPLFVQRKYSILNAEETLATFHQIMVSDVEDKIDQRERLEYVDDLYPWLIKEWLGFFVPSEQAKDILEDLGYNVP